MNLEVNLVKTSSIDSKMSKFLARTRYEVTGDTEVLDAIEKFIHDNVSTFTAALTDQSLVAKLENPLNLTISTFNCLRYVLAEKGLDIWIWYVKNGEVDENEVTPDCFEYNVVDYDQCIGFVPFCVRFIQDKQSFNVVKLYGDIQSAFGLFEGSLFTDMRNPLLVNIDAMKIEQDAVGKVSSLKTTYVNSILDFLKKDVRVITE